MYIQVYENTQMGQVPLRKYEICPNTDILKTIAQIKKYLSILPHDEWRYSFILKS